MMCLKTSIIAIIITTVIIVIVVVNVFITAASMKMDLHTGGSVQSAIFMNRHHTMVVVMVVVAVAVAVVVVVMGVVDVVVVAAVVVRVYLFVSRWCLKVSDPTCVLYKIRTFTSACYFKLRESTCAHILQASKAGTRFPSNLQM